MRKMTSTKSKIWHLLGWGVLLILIILTVVIILNRTWLVDWYHNISYQPSAEMAAIRDRIALTDQGTFLFNATTPELNEAETFNQICRDDESAVAVLGCYTAGIVHVYNITAPEFDGIREVTTAHELLHANWSRLSDAEQNELLADLNQVLEDNQATLADELATYSDTARNEELYVRAGTEILNLPTNLAQHYDQLFQNRAKIVDFYNNYIAVFDQTKARAETLERELTDLKAKIDSEIDSYELEAKNLEKDVADFNDCASTPNCFRIKSEFVTERSTLLSRQNSLSDLNDQINSLINAYNTKIEEYNQNAARSQELQSMINSNAAPNLNIQN